LKIIIADDEPLARARLAALLAECAGAELVASVADGEAAWQACADTHADLLLLDINMPGLNGTALAARLATLPDAPQVVFCTAYEHFAAQAYDLGAADYLLKPVRVERLREALQRARRLREPESAMPRQPGLGVRVRGEQRRIALDDVVYLLADDKYVVVHHAGGEAVIEDSLRQLEQAWPRHLVRLHRNCLVPARRLLGLRTLADGRVVARLAGSDFAPEVSRRNLPAVRKLLRPL
jgi:two-component system response regulator AlgR